MAKTLPILALDMARLTGYAIWSGKKLKKSGTIALAEPAQPGLACLGLHKWLRKLSCKSKLFVTYEMPIAYGNRTGVGRGFHLEGILMAFCEQRGFRYRCVPQSWLRAPTRAGCTSSRITSRPS